MAKISMRNVQKSMVAEYFNPHLSSAATKGVKGKTFEAQQNCWTSQDFENMMLKMRKDGLAEFHVGSGLHGKHILISLSSGTAVPGRHRRIWRRVLLPG